MQQAEENAPGRSPMAKSLDARSGAEDPRAPQSVGVTLVLSFAAVVASFVGATCYGELRARQIERAALTIESDAAPSVRRLANARRYIRLSGQTAQIIGRKQCDPAGPPGNLTAGRIGINIINPAIIWVVKSSAAQRKSITQNTGPETYLRGIISRGIERRRMICCRSCSVLERSPREFSTRAVTPA